MNILVLGGGGREHALIKALRNSKKVKNVACAPGNPGMAKEASAHLTDPTDMRKVLELAGRVKPDLVVVGPEAPLAHGVADALRRQNYNVFGPNQRAAQLESSKVFSKEFMEKYKIPTAKFVVCMNKEEITVAKDQFPSPWVVKADGLAAGKGVHICGNDTEFKKTITEFFDKKTLGTATTKVLLEEHLDGEEISVLCLIAGEKYQILPLAQDYKRLEDGAKGPNTGGMGAYAPVKKWTKELKKIEEKIIIPTVKGLEGEHFDYRGVLYFGVMIKNGEPYLLEYNVRFGDPEAQVILPLMTGDWAEAFLQISQGKQPKLTWSKNSAVCVVIAAPGYPTDPKRGLRVIVDKEFLKKTTPQNYYIHAGTASHNGYITAGGRVLNTIAIDKSAPMARKKAYDLINGIILEGKLVRSDIAAETGPTPKEPKAKAVKAAVKLTAKKKPKAAPRMAEKKKKPTTKKK